MNILKSYETLLKQNPLSTKSFTSFIIFAAGDLLCQWLTYKKEQKGYDWKRVLRGASYGFLIAPFLHFQYSIAIPKLLPIGTKIVVIKSVIYDQIVTAIIMNSTYFFYMDLISGKTIEHSKEQLKQKFMPTMYDNWKFWPFVMFSNFYLIPPQFSVLYVNLWGVVWGAYLSYLQNVIN